jgi:hypothetical protein
MKQLIKTSIASAAFLLLSAFTLFSQPKFPQAISGVEEGFILFLMVKHLITGKEMLTIGTLKTVVWWVRLPLKQS